MDARRDLTRRKARSAQVSEAGRPRLRDRETPPRRSGATGGRRRTTATAGDRDAGRADAPPGLDAAAFRRALLAWYARHRRDLPWRGTRDPWAIWVSEVMLQQTRVEAVRLRFEPFLAAFPDAAALARAPEEEALAAWSGLGYYSRARNLRRGAAVVAERHGGRFPRDIAEARSVPGVGPYTAAAVLSIAYELPHAVVDGNVARVLARLRCLEPPEDSPRSLATLAQTLLDPRRPGEANQALMELGAVVCLPRRPRCGDCPVARLCRARSRCAQAEYPRPRRRVQAVAHHLRIYLLRDRWGRLLLERGSWPILPHLWLPLVREDGGGLPRRLVLVAPAERLGRFRHAITRHRISFEVWGGRFRPGAGRLPRDLRLAGAAELPHLGRSSILEKALRCEGLKRDRIDAAPGEAHGPPGRASR